MTKRTYLVTGAASGLGKAIVETIVAKGEGGRSVISWDSAYGDDVRTPMARGEQCPPIDVLINCAGINRTGWLDQMPEATWDEVMDVNAKGIFMMTKWALPQLIRSQGTVLNIISNASHMPMTCSAAYNASKGAAHILTLQMARELTKKHGITVFGISPNKLSGTQMSRDIEAQVVRDRGWTPEFAAEYQRAALLCGEETNPAVLAEFVTFLLQTKERHKYLTGCVIPYGA